MKLIHKLFFIILLKLILGQKESDILKPERSDVKEEKSELKEEKSELEIENSEKEEKSDPEIENSEKEEEISDSIFSESEDDDDDLMKKLKDFEFNTDEFNTDEFNLDEFNLEEGPKDKKSQKGKNENKQKSKKQKPRPLVARASQRFKDLFSWGKNNSLNFSKIMRFSKNNKLAAEKFISIDDIILDIPPEVMLNVKSALSLLNSKKMRKAYNQYIEEDKKGKIRNETIEDDFHLDQSFLSYILYMVEHKKKHYEKTEFYKYYKHIFYMFEDNLDRTPFYYSSEQMRLFYNTTFGTLFETLNRYFNDEASIFEKKIYKKPIVFEDYLKYRIFSVQKFYNVSGVANIVPFIDLIKQDENEPNCVFYEENGHIKVRAILNVFPKEELILKPMPISNTHRLFFYGQTFDDIIDKFPSYNIPLVARNFLRDQKVEIGEELDKKISQINNNIDLADPEFYKYVVETYQEIGKNMKKKRKSEIAAYRLFMKYLKKMRSNLDYVNDEKIREAFYNKIDIKNAQRIFKGERQFLDKKIEVLKNQIEELRKLNQFMKKTKDGYLDIDNL